MTNYYSDRFGYDPNIPEEIRDIFMWLCQDVVYIQRIWNFYLDLFTHEKIDKVSGLIPASFSIIEETIRNDMVMSICRISDPPRSMGKDNLTFLLLVQKCQLKGMDSLVQDFLIACEPIRQLRNKRVGHNDMGTRINTDKYPLPIIGKNHIDKILLLAKQILNTVIQAYVVDTELYFEPFEIGGAKELMHWLDLGIQHNEDSYS